MASITDGFKDIFLAGVGAMALGAEKSKDLVEQLIAKGEITVEQGKQLNAELKHSAVKVTADLRDDVIAAHLASMTAAERDEFAAKVAAMTAAANAKEAEGSVADIASEPADVAASVAAAEEAAAEKAEKAEEAAEKSEA